MAVALPAFACLDLESNLCLGLAHGEVSAVFFFLPFFLFVCVFCLVPRFLDFSMEKENGTAKSRRVKGKNDYKMAIRRKRTRNRREQGKKWRRNR